MLGGREGFGEALFLGNAAREFVDLLLLTREQLELFCSVVPAVGTLTPVSQPLVRGILLSSENHRHGFAGFFNGDGYQRLVRLGARDRPGIG